jgi:hypothetical protein
MDTQKFDAITRLAGTAPDRRSALKLAGAAALLGTAGFLSRSDDAAALVTVIITDSLVEIDDITVEVNNNKVAVQICAIVEVLDADLLGNRLTCTIDQSGGGGGGGGQQARRQSKRGR